MSKTCGDFGGVTLEGKPCGKPVKDGPCPDHTPEALQELADKKAAFLELFEQTTVQTAAAAKIRTSLVSVWRWRQADQEFDAAVRALDDATADARYRMMEDGLYSRVIRGKASAAEVIFALVNESRRRKDRRWISVQHHRHEGSVGVFGAIQTLPQDEVRRILALPEEERQAELAKLLTPRGLLPPGTPEDGE